MIDRIRDFISLFILTVGIILAGYINNISSYLFKNKYYKTYIYIYININKLINKISSNSEYNYKKIDIIYTALISIILNSLIIYAIIKVLLLVIMLSIVVIINNFNLINNVVETITSLNNTTIGISLIVAIFLLLIKNPNDKYGILWYVNHYKYLKSLRKSDNGRI